MGSVEPKCREIFDMGRELMSVPDDLIIGESIIREVERPVFVEIGSLGGIRFVTIEKKAGNGKQKA